MTNLAREAQELVESLRALADPRRLAIVLALRDGPMRVKDLAEHLGISQQAASYVPRWLNMAGLVAYERRGREIYYSLDHEALRRLGGRVSELAGGDGRRRKGK